MAKIKASIFILISWLLLAFTVHAESPPETLNENPTAFDITQLQSLFEAYQRMQAYAYARRYLSVMEGNPYFDYFYGVSAIDTGKASEGVFALERVLLTFPDDQVARLELARGYFVLQEYALSRQAFEQVLNTNPPATVRDTAEAYLDKIRVSESRYRPTHSGFIDFSMGNDDNVNAGVDENSTFQLVSLLTAESFGQDDNFASLNGAWTYIHPFSPGWLFESTLSADLRKNQELDQFDTTTGTMQLGISHLQGTHKYKAEIIAQQFQLDGNEYRSLSGVNLDWQYTLSEQSSINSTLQVAQLDYPDLAIKNSDLGILGISYIHAFSAYLQPVVFTSINAGKEQAEQNTNPTALSDTERNIYSLRAGVILSFTNTLALQSAAGLQKSEFAGAPFFQPDVLREDDYTTADIALLWAFERKWRLETRYSHTENNSNYDLRDYERNVFDMSINYTF